MRVDEVREGVKVGKLTAIKSWGSARHYSVRWLFHCDCGNDTVVTLYRVGALTNSCGHCGICSKDLHNNQKESMYYSLYSAWSAMRGRCQNSNNRVYHHYGGRGIKVCDVWDNSYSAFKKWALDNGWKPNLTQKDQSLDRIDVNGNYEPDNCRWVDSKTQGGNRRNTILVDYKDKKVTLMKLEQITGINYDVIHRRYDLGLRGEDLIKPIRGTIKHLFKGELLTIDEINKKYNIQKDVLYYRIKNNSLNELENRVRIM